MDKGQGSRPRLIASNANTDDLCRLRIFAIYAASILFDDTPRPRSEKCMFYNPLLPHKREPPYCHRSSRSFYSYTMFTSIRPLKEQIYFHPALSNLRIHCPLGAQIPTAVLRRRRP